MKLFYILLLLPSLASAQLVRGDNNPLSINGGTMFGPVTLTTATMTGPLTLAGSSLTVTGGGIGIGMVPTQADLNLAKSKSIRFQNNAANNLWNTMFVDSDNLYLQYPNNNSFYIRDAAGVQRMAINSAGAVTIPGSSFSVGTSTLVVSGGLVGFSAYTIAQFDAINPGAAGRMATCTNCAVPYRICVSTGTGRGAFVNEGTTDHCQ